MTTKKSSVDMIKVTPIEELKDVKDSIGKTVQPDWASRERHEAHDEEEPGGTQHMGGLTSVRNFQHQGRSVVINTTYEIKIAGQPYKGHAAVDDEGRIHCHAIPYDTYPSAVDFVKQLINLYPESFPKDESCADDDDKTKVGREEAS
ncbi:MAG: hypothetical protein O7D34_09505 [Ignavibacteria bacterium]|nr:hypothetical protein [Ignavibacteria bacterium]